MRTLLLLLALCPPLMALPGENVEQVEKRFGTVVSTRPSAKGRIELRRYRVKDGPVDATFLDGKCVQETFEIPSFAAAEELLKTFTPRTEWRKTSFIGQEPVWEQGGMQAYTETILRKVGDPSPNRLLLFVATKTAKRDLKEADPPQPGSPEPFDFGRYHVR